jgi:hypothetical protein
MRSFIFCTSYINSTSEDHKVNRYKRWVKYYLPLLKEFNADRLFLIDDGGNVIDNSFHLIQNDLPDTLEHEVNLYRFSDSLGRKTLVDFPGWWRSYLFSIEIARKYDYSKIIHIESDFFILSNRLKKFIGNASKGWSSLFSSYYNFPETAIQVICKDAFPAFEKLKKEMEYNNYVADSHAEYLIPFTKVKKNFIGDRIGDGQVYVKWINDQISQLSKLDYIGQINIPESIDL